MALVEFNFESQYLGNNHCVGIILPDKPRGITPKDFYGSGKKYPVIWLLHGTYGDYSDWIRKSNIELYACENDIIIVMPSAMNSDYSNWPNFGTGYHMWDYLTEELMPLVYNWFPASAKREDNYVAGLSMGGRGALTLALQHPDKFIASAVLSSSGRNYDFLKPHAKTNGVEFQRKVLSGELKFEEAAAAINIAPRQLNAIAKYPTVGDFLASQENTFDRFEEAVKAKKLIKMYCAIGTKDNLYGNYVKFKEHAAALKADVLFEEIEGYAHEWRFWDITIEKAISFFGLKKAKADGNPY
ncbi:MAG: alpha/beta hydrolase-fold protein [Treponema sp.]|nr:alpha/beta hydrolase-fold protein [Treponema sp.]